MRRMKKLTKTMKISALLQWDSREAELRSEDE